MIQNSALRCLFQVTTNEKGLSWTVIDQFLMENVDTLDRYRKNVKNRKTDNEC